MLLGRMRTAVAPLRDVLKELHNQFAPNQEGSVANYIPELANADPKSFGISIATVDGQVFEVGDCKKLFTLQSISKAFLYGMALEDHGVEKVLQKVGVEPTGDVFNSIELDEGTNRPFNPMVNAGAIATAALVKGKDFPERVSRMMAMFSRYMGRQAYVDNSVFMSERMTGHRNRAIGHLMLNFQMVEGSIEETLDLYFQQCSVLAHCSDLALMGATLANGGLNPLTKERALEQRYVKYLLSIMLSCGMYDYAGEWAFRVGIPSKSGVGGGIVGVIPGKFGIGVYSPPLDAKGNSVRGIQVFRELSERFGMHVFESGFEGPSLSNLLTPTRGAARSSSQGHVPNDSAHG